MIVPLYDDGGRYRGFVAGQTVYGRNGRPVGVIEDERVFNLRHELIGELTGQTIVSVAPRRRPRATGSGGALVAWVADRLRLATTGDPFDRLERA